MSFPLLLPIVLSAIPLTEQETIDSAQLADKTIQTTISSEVSIIPSKPMFRQGTVTLTSGVATGGVIQLSNKTTAVLSVELTTLTTTVSSYFTCEFGLDFNAVNDILNNIVFINKVYHYGSDDFNKPALFTINLPFHGNIGANPAIRVVGWQFTGGDVNYQVNILTMEEI